MGGLSYLGTGRMMSRSNVRPQGMVNCQATRGPVGFINWMGRNIVVGAAGGAAGGAVNYLAQWSTSDEQWDNKAFLQSVLMGGVTGGVGALGLYTNARVCFVAGTPLLTPDGSKPIEQFKVGDLLLSRDENDPEGPVEAKVVEECFVRVGRVLNLKVGGQVIGTTAEHPFWVRGKGWLPASEIIAGDDLLGHDGRWVVVEGKEDTGERQTVYNLEVASYHTYFIGALEWRFSVWAHNAYIDTAIKNQNATVKSGPNKGKIPYTDPETNTTKVADRGDLDGDHILSKDAFKAAVRERETELGRKLTPAEKAKVSELMNGEDNLRPMPSGHNRAKGSRDADAYAATPTGQNASPEYVAGMKVRQVAIEGRLDTLLQTME